MELVVVNVQLRVFMPHQAPEKSPLTRKRLRNTLVAKLTKWFLASHCNP
ncbi:hypothetical protein CRENPOLYSF1_450013 [Crenothrix polyspora]|uniref:Uncharacterized protein n=1 Tax=Crenothrix polyspora TaxID=360316 RepID=A0A1R4HBN3_9GAMM|nr:hypothetical protein CRENPOLYSF1_450013 [Crenothrix polyspora]